MGIFCYARFSNISIYTKENHVKNNTLVEPSHFVEYIPGMTIIIITFDKMSS